MANKNNTHGGKREGAGRKVTPYKKSLMVRISDEAYDIIKDKKNKSEYIDTIIKLHK